MLRTYWNWEHGLGPSFRFCMENASLSIAALCHAKNLPELETWFRDISYWNGKGGSSISTVEL